MPHPSTASMLPYAPKRRVLVYDAQKGKQAMEGERSPAYSTPTVCLASPSPPLTTTTTTTGRYSSYRTGRMLRKLQIVSSHHANPLPGLGECSLGMPNCAFR